MAVGCALSGCWNMCFRAILSLLLWVPLWVLVWISWFQVPYQEMNKAEVWTLSTAKAQVSHVFRWLCLLLDTDWGHGGPAWFLTSGYFFFFRFPFVVGRLRECWRSFKGPVQASSSWYIASRPHLLLSGDHQHSGHRAHKTSEPGPAILLLSLLPPGCFIASSCLTHLHIPTTKLLLCPPSSFLFRAYFYLPIYSCYFIFGHTGSSLLVNSRLAFP